MARERFTSTDRILIAASLLLLDLAVFFLPLASILIAYVVLTRPQWFKDFVDNVYEG